LERGRVSFPNKIKGGLMFGIGLSELFVILCIAVLFVRPKDLPKVFRLCGKAYARLKIYYDELSSMKDEMLTDIKSEFESAETPKNTAQKNPATDENDAFLP
jgi:sec-independent protein translocase protein TatB